MVSLKVLATTCLLSGAALGDVLTTIVPCSGMPNNSTVTPITVTKQHQPVSTCKPSGTTISWSTYEYVSTVIPCWGGSSSSSCTVTETAQPVPCSGSASTITSITPVTTGIRDGTTTTISTSYLTSYETVSKQWVAPYNQLGPYAIPGYGGCELCKECGPQADGSRKQFMNVTECTSAAGKQPVCSRYSDFWISQPVPSTTGIAKATASSKAEVLTAGVYTYTFPQPAPSTIIESGGQSYTVPAQPWTAYVTKSCSGRTTFDFTVTVTKTVTFNVPYSTSTDPKKTPAPGGFDHQGWGAWKSPTTSTSGPTSTKSWGAWSTPSITSSRYDDPARNNFHWGAWSDSTLSTSTVTLTTLSTTATSTYGITITSTKDGPQPSKTFFVEVSAAGVRRHYVKIADINYIGFPDGSDDATLVKENPAVFYFDSESYLKTGSFFVLGDSSSGFFVFEKTSDKPATPPKFSLTADGTFGLQGAGFCATNANLFITFGSAPSDCKAMSCTGSDGTIKTTTTTSAPTTTATTTWAETTTTTTTADISADLDVADPTAAPGLPRRGVRYGRRSMHGKAARA